MKRSPLVALTAAVCCLAVPVAASAATTSVVAGPPIKRAPAGVPKDGDLNQFFPSAVKIHVGDKVSWTVAGFHVVQFPKAGSAPPQLAVPDPSRPATGVNDAAGQPFWFNGQGKLTRYADIGAGQTFPQQTFASHMWEIRAGNGDCVMIYQAGSVSETVEIR